MKLLLYTEGDFHLNERGFLSDDKGVENKSHSVLELFKKLCNTDEKNILKKLTILKKEIKIACKSMHTSEIDTDAKNINDNLNDIEITVYNFNVFDNEGVNESFNVFLKCLSKYASAQHHFHGRYNVFNGFLISPSALFCAYFRKYCSDKTIHTDTPQLAIFEYLQAIGKILYIRFGVIVNQDTGVIATRDFPLYGMRSFFGSGVDKNLLW